MKTGCCGGCSDKHEAGVEVEAKSPPGWSKSVEKMKEDHGDKIDNPFALAWWMKNKGYTPHHKSASLSPGEKSLLEAVRRVQHLKIKNLMRDPDFHGWGPEDIQILIDRLKHLGLVEQKNGWLSIPQHSPSSYPMTMAARVAARFYRRVR